MRVYCGGEHDGSKGGHEVCNALDGATLDPFGFVFCEIDEDHELFVSGEDQAQWTRCVRCAARPLRRAG
jgi:hypothetical protein